MNAWLQSSLRKRRDGRDLAHRRPRRKCAARVPKIRLSVRHRQTIEVRELRIDDVVVAVSQIPARQPPSQYVPAVAVFVDRVVDRVGADRRVHPPHMSLVVNQEKLYALPAKRAG
jgi:hypothetical protein